MAQPAQGKSVPWAGTSARSLTKPLGCAAASLAAAVFVFAWSGEDLSAGVDDIRMAEDKNIVRFSEHCSAPGDGVEGALAQGGEAAAGPQLRAALVLLAPGDSSAARPWPGEAPPGPTWDCRPEALPRYWRLNKHVRFAAYGPDGAELTTSFTPDFLPPRPSADADEPPDEYLCAPGQLTAAGFRQAVFLGRHLAEAYGGLLGRGSSKHLHVRSVDTKRSLASAVGLLMAFLAAPQLVKLFGDGSEVPIHAWPNDTSSSPQIEEMELGDHLLARWCHQMSWPCHTGFFEGTRCVSVEQAAERLAKGEAELCRSPPPLGARHSGPGVLAEEVERLRGAEDGSFALASVGGPALAAALRLLLGDAVCDDPLSLRPPYTSRLVLERWQLPASGELRWRILWNGADVSAKVPGCEGNVAPACSEAALRALLGPAPGAAG